MTRAKAFALTPRERRWLSTLGWMVGLALFVRLAQILPCCAPPSEERGLRHHSCEIGFAAICPKYDCSTPH